MDRRPQMIRRVALDAAELRRLTKDGRRQQAQEFQYSPVKMQLFELLCALCMYSSKGHEIALDALQHFKDTHERHNGYDEIMSELRNTTDVTYQTRLLSFINCLTLGCNNVQKRIQIRNEFLDRNLGALLNSLNAVDDTDLQFQVLAFSAYQHNDKIELQSTEQQSHHQLFETVFKKVVDTPHAAKLYSILLNLSQLDPASPNADSVWEALDSLSSEANKSGFSISKYPVHNQECQGTTVENCWSIIRRHSDNIFERCTVSTQTEVENSRELEQIFENRVTSPPAVEVSLPASTPPPPPPPPPPLALIPEVPAVSTLASSGSPHVVHVPPPPPIPHNSSLLSQKRHSLPNLTHSPSSWSPVKYKFNTLPLPRRKMKTLNWKKIPVTAIGDSVWTELQNKTPNLAIDFKQMEELFCCKTATVKCLKFSKGIFRSPIKPKITLLETKRDLAVNIYLKQFKSGGKAVVDAIRNLKGADIGVEKLRALLPLLPTEKELTSIRSCSEDVDHLGEAEKFYFQLSEVPSFALRIKSLLLKEEFSSKTLELKGQLDAVAEASNKLMTNKNLKEFLALTLQLGNYINAGSYAGNAAGFSLSTLPKLLEIKANKPKLTFLHYVVEVAEANNKDILQFTEDLSNMKEMSRISLELLQEEVEKVTSDVKYVESQLQKDTSGIKSHFEDFLNVALECIHELQQAMNRVKAASRALAKHFCEDLTTFKTEECFRLLAEFLNLMERARQENEEKRKAEQMKIERNKLTPRRGIARKKFSPHRQYIAVKQILHDICNENFKLRKTEA